MVDMLRNQLLTMRIPHGSAKDSWHSPTMGVFGIDYQVNYG
jgi:hypothetical protein